MWSGVERYCIRRQASALRHPLRIEALWRVAKDKTHISQYLDRPVHPLLTLPTKLDELVRHTSQLNLHVLRETVRGSENECLRLFRGGSESVRRRLLNPVPIASSSA